MKIVFLHWLGQNHESWEKVIENLDIDAEFFTPHLFDFCKNEKNFDEMYSWLENFLAKFDEPIILCGLSLGGTLALQYVIRHNKKISGLIIIGARMKIPKFLMSVQNMIFHLFPEKVFLKMGMKKSEFIEFSHSMTSIDLSANTSRISCPVGIFVWEKDFFNKTESIRISQKIKNSSLVFIKNSGHEVNMENPILLAQEITNFLKTNSYR